MVKSLRGPKLMAHSTPPTRAMTDESIVAFRRVMCFSSQKYVMEISLMETVEVSDARNSSRKKRVDHIIPPGNWLKM